MQAVYCFAAIADSDKACQRDPDSVIAAALAWESRNKLCHWQAMRSVGRSRGSQSGMAEMSERQQSAAVGERLSITHIFNRLVIFARRKRGLSGGYYDFPLGTPFAL